MDQSIIKTLAQKSKIIRRLWAIYSLMREDSYLNQVGWFKSIGQRLLNSDDQESIPWYTYSAIAFLKNRVNKEMLVFEFGSGNSTIWWSGKVKKIVGCEHDKDWYSLLKPVLSENVEYLLYELGPDGEYTRAASKYSETFDIIVLDGKDRNDCAKNSISALKSDGVIIWDNSDYDDFIEGHEFLRIQGFSRLDFFGMVHFGAIGSCTSIFYRPENCLGI